ncbi:MAG: ABZJ_00895 family protein [Pseudomonadota bacterium]
MSAQIPVGQHAVLAYVGIFALCYLGLTGVVFALLTLTPLQGNAGFAVGALIGSATLAAQKFHADIGRPPLGLEVIKLALCSFLAIIVVSAPLTIAALVLSGVAVADLGLAFQVMFGEQDTNELASFVGLTIAIHLLVLWLSYGPLARFIARNSKR